MAKLVAKLTAISNGSGVTEIARERLQPQRNRNKEYWVNYKDGRKSRNAEKKKATHKDVSLSKI